MATSAGTSNLKKPLAWLAAGAVYGLVLASSTALYVVNSSVKLPLPWWTAVAAPLIVYALVLPLCVPRMRLGGWLLGLLTLAVLHVGIALSTAWLYAMVGFTSFEQALPPALWGFPPALVLAMVGSLLMILPFLGALAPRAAARRLQAASAPARAGPAASVAQAVSALPGTAMAAPTLEEPPPAVEKHPPAVEEYGVIAPDESLVHAAPLSGWNGGAPEAPEAEAPAPASEEPAPTAVPDFRQALAELFGTPAAPPGVDEVPKPPDELVAEEPSFAGVAAAAPVVSEAVVRIPFDRVAGQLPPGAFRLPLGQVGARLREAGMLVVPQALILPQLGEGVVQVAWEVVAEQFPAAVFAVAPVEVKERIVNGRLLLPLDEIVRQLPPDVFAASIGRGPVEVPGIESFPVPFKPLGWEEAPVTTTRPRGEPEPLSIEVPDAAEVARDLALTLPETDLRVPDVSPYVPPDVSIEEIEPVQAPSGPELAAASLLEETRRAEPAEPPQNVVEIEEVSEVLDLDSLLESTSTPAPAVAEAGRGPDAMLAPPAQPEPPDELVAEEPSFAGVAAAAPVVSEAVVLPQLDEGVVQVAWEVVAEQFPAAVFAVAPVEVKERIVNGRLLLPLDEIVRQLPPDVFAASIGRGPVEVPGIESFPVPFKPLGWDAPPEAAVAEPAVAAAPAGH